MMEGRSVHIQWTRRKKLRHKRYGIHEAHKMDKVRNKFFLPPVTLSRGRCKSIVRVITESHVPVIHHGVEGLPHEACE